MESAPWEGRAVAVRSATVAFGRAEGGAAADGVGISPIFGTGDWVGTSVGGGASSLAQATSTNATTSKQEAQRL